MVRNYQVEVITDNLGTAERIAKFWGTLTLDVYGQPLQQVSLENKTAL